MLLWNPNSKQSVDLHWFAMGFKGILLAVLTTVALSKPIPDPLHVIRQSGPAAGQVSLSNHLQQNNNDIKSKRSWNQADVFKVITKCNAPGQIALAYDDGPYQYTQVLAKCRIDTTQSRANTWK